MRVISLFTDTFLPLIEIFLNLDDKAVDTSHANAMSSWV
jgi:hypothetical protein